MGRTGAVLSVADYGLRGPWLETWLRHNGRKTQTNCDEAEDYVVLNVLSPRDLVSRPDNMDENLL